MNGQEAIAEALDRQAHSCSVLGSDLYSRLLTRAATDVRRAGPVWRVLEPFAGEPTDSAVALRLMAAVHRLVLTGAAPGLAAHYPSAGGSPKEAAWDEFCELMISHDDELRYLIAMPMQTNEVGRCAPLVVGLIAASARSPVPLRLLEVGASAGLNLAWDLYSYTAGRRSLGQADSPVRFSREFEDGLPAGPEPVIAERRGCDLAPLDLRSQQDRLTLVSSTWADQPWRIERQRAALELVRSDPPAVDRASAGEWLEEQLASVTQTEATLVFHSIVWQYLGQDEQERITTALSDFAADNPSHALHHLVMDRDGDLASLTLATWPGGDPKVIARTGYHGNPVLLTG